MCLYHGMWIYPCKVIRSAGNLRSQPLKRFASSLCLPAGQKIVHYPSSVCVQVATEWLYSVPDHILDRHLAADPSTPKTTTSVGAAAIDRNRALVPGRVPLQVWTLVVLGHMDCI